MGTAQDEPHQGDEQVDCEIHLLHVVDECHFVTS
jgi:hypothetical protein